MHPLVEAFGYRNVQVDGYEADDVIATLATQAKEKGVEVMIVTGDRDTFQLIEPGIQVMATSRGITETKIYDREAVIERYGIPPELIPDFIGLKGDTSDNIPGVPGIGDKTAGQLIQRHGSLEAVLEAVDTFTPARAKALREHADQARDSKLLATMRRDLELDFDPAELVLAPPDRSQLKEMFRRFEFRGLLSRIDSLDEALPAAERPQLEGVAVPWRSGELPAVDGALRVEEGQAALADGDGVTLAPWSS